MTGNSLCPYSFAAGSCVSAVSSSPSVAVSAALHPTRSNRPVCQAPRDDPCVALGGVRALTRHGTRTVGVDTVVAAASVAYRSFASKDDLILGLLGRTTHEPPNAPRAGRVAAHRLES
jgi:hypothetical protein